jgi:hypothetical protein
MTVIVGLVDNGSVWVGGDSAGVGPGWSLSIRTDPKVFRSGPYVMGFTSSFRMGQLLRWTLKATAPKGDIECFMATVFVDAVRQCLKDGGWATKDSEQEKGGDFLVGVHGRLFTVANDYQVGEAAAPYAAVGSGADVALGAMYASAGMRPAARLKTALTAAERHNAGVRGPYVVLHSKVHVDE